MIRVFVPEGLAIAFLAFIDQKSRENRSIIEKFSPARNEQYLIELNSKALVLFDQCKAAGKSATSSISEVNKQLKVLGFHNVSYDNVKTLLRRLGCFKPSLAIA